MGYTLRKIIKKKYTKTTEEISILLKLWTSTSHYDTVKYQFNLAFRLLVFTVLNENF